MSLAGLGEGDSQPRGIFRASVRVLRDRCGAGQPESLLWHSFRLASSPAIRSKWKRKVSAKENRSCNFSRVSLHGTITCMGPLVLAPSSPFGPKMNQSFCPLRFKIRIKAEMEAKGNAHPSNFGKRSPRFCAESGPLFVAAAHLGSANVSFSNQAISSNYGNWIT